MPVTIEHRGVRALEYAAQTGAQLMRRRRDGELAQPIDADIAHSLWRLGAAHQIVCIAVDHHALAKAQPYPGWAYTLRRSVRRLVRAFRLGTRTLGNLGDQLAFTLRSVRLRAITARVEVEVPMADSSVAGPRRIALT
jgi:hypothetical protein